jgi:hypothetical protein
MELLNLFSMFLFDIVVDNKGNRDCENRSIGLCEVGSPVTTEEDRDHPGIH